MKQNNQPKLQQLLGDKQILEQVAKSPDAKALASLLTQGQDQASLKQIAESQGAPVEAAPADIAAIIEQAMDVVAEKRKSRKEEGEEVGDITSEEIMEAVGELLDAAGADEEAKEDEDAGDEEAKGAGHTGGEHKRQKGATRPKQTKTARQGAAPVQRKYSSLFLSAPLSCYLAGQIRH